MNKIKGNPYEESELIRMIKATEKQNSSADHDHDQNTKDKSSTNQNNQNPSKSEKTFQMSQQNQSTQQN